MQNNDCKFMNILNKRTENMTKPPHLSIILIKTKLKNAKTKYI